MTTLDELERLANEATPGPWEVGDLNETGGYDCMTAAVFVGPFTLDCGDYGQRSCEELTSPVLLQTLADARYLSAVSPETIKAMIQLVQQMRDVLRVLHGLAWNEGAATGGMVDEILAAYEQFEKGGR